MKKVLCITVIVLLSGLYQVNAQTANPYWGLYGALAKPTGDFGSTESDKAGAAETGYGAGIEYTKPMNSPGLSWVSNVSIIMNGFDEESLGDFSGSGLNVDDPAKSLSCVAVNKYLKLLK